MRLLPSIVCLGLVCLSCRVAAGDFKAGQYDALALEQLRATLEVAPLKTLTVHDVNAEFVLEKQEGLTWKEALAEADRRFGEQQPQRALFLRKYVATGVPEAQLSELRWPPSWMNFTSGLSTQKQLDWFGPEIHAKLRAARDRNGGNWNKGMTIDLFQTRPMACIEALIENGKVSRPPELTFPDIKLKGLAFLLLSFDGDDHLSSVLREVSIEGAGVTMQVSYPWGPPGTGACDVSITDRDHNWESLNYGPDLKLESRWVQARGQTFHEIYENGRLRKRVHTDGPPQVDEQGRDIEKAEVFP